MKSINAKKIAAVTFGAALLGASFVAAAPIMYKNTQIINEQGKPVVKIVVGANAKASDGVAAANIAAVIGSLAYQSKTVSAKLIGTPTCTVTGTGAGTCQVSDKKVTLEITTPGTATVAGGYGFRTYGYGFIDNVGTTEDDQIANSSVPKKITGDNMAALADYKSSISSVSGAFTETQEMYIEQTSQPAMYDTDAKKYSIRPDKISYFIKFDHDTFGGVPMNIKESELKLNDSLWNSDNKIDRQRLKIKFLGEEWIISDMTNGTSVKLAKEASPAQIVYAGQSITAGAYTVKLADLTIPYGSTDSQAIVQVYDSNNQLVKEDTAPAGQTKDITLPNGDKISLHVYKTAPGLTTAKWAEMAVFTQELELKDGSTIDDDKNKNWTVTLGWSTYGGSSAPVQNNVLESITLTRTDFDDLFEGQSVNIIESPTPYQFNFAGWTLTDAQRDNLKVSWERVSNYYDTESNTTATSITDSDARDFVCFTSDKKAFSNLYIAGNLTAYSFGGDDRAKWCYGIKNGTVLYDKPDKGYIFAGQVDSSNNSAYVKVDYKINDDSSYDTNITINDLNVTHANVTIYERLLKNDPSKLGYFQFVADQPNRRFVNNLADVSESKIHVGYLGSSGAITTAEREAGFTSQKGSVIASRSSSAITFKMAKKLGEFQYFIKPSSSSVEAGTSTQTLSEGQQVTVQDSTVKVKQISETVGACSVSGGESACTASSAGMSAVLDIAGTPASATFAVPYKMSATDRLVVLDSEAPSAESLILVGGQLVNTLTASAIAGTDVKIDKPGVKVVSAVSDNRIVVAGYTAQDTQEAASQFISELLAQVQ